MPKNFSKSVFAERLRELRGNRSQKTVAEVCGMKQPMYARYESGATLPSAELIFRICTTLECTSDYLLGLSDTQPVKRTKMKSSI